MPSSTSHLLIVEPRLHVHDLGKAIAFYRDVLGFEVTTLFPPQQPVFAMLRRGRVCLQFGGPGGKRAEGSPSTCTLYFDATDVVTLHDQLKERTRIEWGPEVYFYGRREFAVRDPDGNLLVFSEETSDPPTCREE
jgi:uncharacterized glyoxalase superfamily protein PhnB